MCVLHVYCMYVMCTAYMNDVLHVYAHNIHHIDGVVLLCTVPYCTPQYSKAVDCDVQFSARKLLYTT